MHMAKPAETALFQQTLDTVHLCTVKNLVVCDPVVIPDAKNASEVSKMKRIQALFLCGIGGP